MGSFDVLLHNYSLKVQQLRADIASANGILQSSRGLANLIETAMKSTDPEMRLAAESSIDILRKSNILNHAMNVFLAIAVETNENTLMCLTTYAYSLARVMEDLTYIQTLQEDFLQTLTVLFHSLRNPQLTKQMIFIMCETIVSLAEITPINQPEMVTIVALIEVEEKFNSSDRREFFIGLNVLHSLLKNLFSSAEVQRVLMNLLNRFFNILDGLLTLVLNEISNQQQQLQVAFHSQQQQQQQQQPHQKPFNEISANLQILKMISQVISVTIQRINKDKTKSSLPQNPIAGQAQIGQVNTEHPMQAFLVSKQLLAYFEMIMKANFNSILFNSTENPINLIVYSPGNVNGSTDSQLSDCISLLNGVKYHTIKSLVSMNQFYVLREREVRELQFDTSELQSIHSAFLTTYENVLQEMCNQLRFCITSKKHDLQNALKTQGDCVQNLGMSITMILRSVQDQRLYRFFSNSSQELFVDIILNLMSNSQSDYENYSSSDEEFLRFEQDLYFARDSDVIKSNSCELLFRLAATIDGFLAYAVRFACSVLKRLSITTTELDRVHSESIAGDYDREEVESVLRSCFSNFLVKVSGISRLRCSAMINAYSLLLFSHTSLLNQKQNRQMTQQKNGSDKLELLVEMITFLLKQFQDTTEPKGVELAIDVLCRLVYRPELRANMECIIKDLIEMLVENISTCVNVNFFDFLAKIIYTYAETIKNSASFIVKSLCTRILKEQVTIEARPMHPTLVVSSCVLCVLRFVNCKPIMDEFYMYFEEYIKQILQFFEQPSRISFIDELCEMGTSVIRYTKEFDETTELVFKNFEKVWLKNRKRLLSSSLIDLLSEIIRSTYLMREKQYVICGCFRLCLASIGELNVRTISSEYSEFIEGCYLLHVGIWYCHGIFPSKQKLFDDLLDFYAEKYVLLSMQAEEFYPIKFVQILLHLFAFYPVETLAKLNYQLVSHVFHGLEVSYAETYLDSTYNRKVLIHGILGIFHNAQAVASISQEHACALMKLILRVLMNENVIKQPGQLEVESDVLAQNAAKGIGNGVLHSVVDDDDDGWLVSNEDPADLESDDLSAKGQWKRKFYENPDRELNERIEKTNPPVCSSDEYSMFRSTMKLFKRKNAEIYNFIVSRLNEQEGQALDSFQKSTIVQVSENHFEVRKLRKFKQKQGYYTENGPSTEQLNEMERE